MKCGHSHDPPLENQVCYHMSPHSLKSRVKLAVAVLLFVYTHTFGKMMMMMLLMLIMMIMMKSAVKNDHSGKHSTAPTFKTMFVVMLLLIKLTSSSKQRRRIGK